MVGSLLVATEPILPTVEWIWEVSIRACGTIGGVASTIRRDCWRISRGRSDTVVVTFIADRPIPTVNQIVIIASIIS